MSDGGTVIGNGANDVGTGTGRRWCRWFGHKTVTNYHSAGFTTYCSRCLLSETVRRPT